MMLMQSQENVSEKVDFEELDTEILITGEEN
jgi:hypothetical protein